MLGAWVAWYTVKLCSAGLKSATMARGASSVSPTIEDADQWVEWLKQGRTDLIRQKLQGQILKKGLHVNRKEKRKRMTLKLVRVKNRLWSHINQKMNLIEV